MARTEMKGVGKALLTDVLPGYPWGSAIEAYASGQGYQSLSAKDQQKLPRSLSLLAAAWVQANGVDPFANARVSRGMRIGIAGTVPDAVKERLGRHFETGSLRYYEPKTEKTPDAAAVLQEAIEDRVDMLVDVNGASGAGAYAQASLAQIRARALADEVPVDCLHKMADVPLVVQANFDPMYEGNMFGVPMERLDHRDVGKIGKLFGKDPAAKMVPYSLPERDGYAREDVLVINTPPRTMPSGGRAFMTYAPPLERHLPILASAAAVGAYAAITLNGSATYVGGTNVRQTVSKLLDPRCLNRSGLDPVMVGLKGTYMRAVGAESGRSALIDDMMQTFEPAVMAMGMMVDDPHVSALLDSLTDERRVNRRARSALGREM